MTLFITILAALVIAPFIIDLLDYAICAIMELIAPTNKGD